MRLAALGRPGPPDPSAPGPSAEEIGRSLVAHLCRCTGWQTIEEAAQLVLGPPPDTEDRDLPARDLETAAVRAGIEGGVPQRVGPEVVLGRAGFADDGRPPDALVAVPDGRGDYVVGASVQAARSQAGTVPGRSSSLALVHPVTVPPGSWDLVLATTWVEPGYVEPDASWAWPGEVPACPYGNGGAFGGKLRSPVAADALRLADRHGRPVGVLWTREDVVRLGPKRPPVAGGIDADGTGVLRVGLPRDGVTGEQWSQVASLVSSVAPGLVLEQAPVVGPPISFDLRAAVWAEAAVLAVCAGQLGHAGDGDGDGRRHLYDIPVEVTAPGGGRAVARCRADGSVHVTVEAGAVLDEVVLRSYAIGATHQALSWVRSEGIAVDEEGVVRDQTVRSFGILQARAMPRVEVALVPDQDRPAVNGSDAVLAAVAAARWLADGLPPQWPTDRSGAGRR
jgi:hypothetical protein